MINSMAEHVALKKQDFNGKDTDAKIEDLLICENLKSCNLFHFYISDDDIEKLNQLKKLQFIKFDMCYFSLESLQFNENIKELSFNLCENLKIKHLSKTNVKKLKIINLKKINIELDLSELEYANNLEEIAIHNCKVKGLERILEKAPNLKKLNLDGSVVENIEELRKLVRKIVVSNEKEFYLTEN